jgi:hypothetical protein
MCSSLPMPLPWLCSQKMTTQKRPKAGLQVQHRRLPSITPPSCAATGSPDHPNNNNNNPKPTQTNMELFNQDGTTKKLTAEDILKMAGVHQPNPKCYSISDALDVIDGLIDGKTAEEDPMAEMMIPLRLTLITLQLIASKCHTVLDYNSSIYAKDDMDNNAEEDAMNILSSIAELEPKKKCCSDFEVRTLDCGTEVETHSFGCTSIER